MKKILGIGFRTITILFTLFSLFYGIIGISLDLTKTINFSNLAEATAARQTQLAICIPYILIGGVLLTLLITHYVSVIRQKNINNLALYGITVTIVGALFFLGFVFIAIYESEFSLIMCIIPALFLLCYGMYSIIAYRRLHS